MNDLRIAAQQALEALESAEFDPHSSDAVYKAITALRAALAEPVQEPAGQLQEDAFGRGQVMWFNKPADLSMLYTAPPQRKPLTEEEIKRLVSNDMVQFARAIERAHGIGGNA